MASSIWFSRSDQGFRAWFSLVRGNGSLRASAVAGDFTFTVVSPDDLGSQEFFVTESVQKPGLYYADIQSSYLITSGTGDYGVSLEVDTGNPQRVRDAFSNVFRVTQEDFDSLSGSIWNAQTSSFSSPGSFGQAIDALTGSSGVSADVDSIVSGVWDATAGSFNTAGTMGRLQNTAGAGGVDIDLLVSGVWDAVADGFVDSNTMGGLMNKIVVMSGSMEKIRKIECGRWQISGSQQIFYDDDSTTPLAIFNLLKPDGSPFIHDNEAVVERVLTSSLA